MAQILRECEIDRQCNGTQVCYNDVSWLQEGESRCLCDTWHGWTGENCTEFGSGSVFFIVSITLQLLALVVGCVIAGIALKNAINRFGCKPNSTVVTVLLSNIALYAFTFGRVAGLAVVLTPELFLELDDHFAGSSTIELKAHPIYLNIERYFIGLGILVSILTTSRVCLLWMDLATLKFDTNRVKKGYRFRKLVYILEAVWVIGTLATSIFSTIVVFWFAIPILCTLMATFIVARQWLLPLLLSMKAIDDESTRRSQKSKTLSTLIYGVRVTSVVMVIGLSVSLFGGILFSYFTFGYNIREYSEQGTVSLALIFNEILYVGIVICLFGCALYGYYVTLAQSNEGSTRKISDKTKTSDNREVSLVPSDNYQTHYTADLSNLNGVSL